MQLNVFYMMLEKLNAYTAVAGYEAQGLEAVEGIYLGKQGDAGAQLHELSITKRGMSTAQIMSQNRVSSAAGSGSAAGAGHSPLRSKAPSISSATGSSSRFTPPISRTNSGGSASLAGAGRAPPPYTAGGSPAAAAAAVAASPASGKRAPPPPPALKARPSYSPKPPMATALYDFQAQNDGDLSFQAGDRITIVEKSESTEDWWVGSLNGMQGTLPANFLKLD